MLQVESGSGTLASGTLADTMGEQQRENGCRACTVMKQYWKRLHETIGVEMNARGERRQEQEREKGDVGYDEKRRCWPFCLFKLFHEDSILSVNISST